MRGSCRHESARNMNTQQRTLALTVPRMEGEGVKCTSTMMELIMYAGIGRRAQTVSSSSSPCTSQYPRWSMLTACPTAGLERPMSACHESMTNMYCCKLGRVCAWFVKE